ncbi:kinase-like domain-containing protein [Mycena belliarum]|uniref:Kinase-like domain-containing protein n=1 Tax=Mycena belliarum TaxID=1033014 RepID=A0AAD6UF99_9AGAR|nr:kinase-like domain-containing protein [Mycena belliae]
MLLNGVPYVAKRFFEIGNGRDIVSIDENTAQLTNEMSRLAQGQWFLDKFYERAEETETRVSSDFTFSTGILAQETIGEREPSAASAVTLQDFLESTSRSPSSAITWLLEPLRASTIERWSGTLDHPMHADKPGKTMDAFMHFSYIYSQRSRLFADLQSQSASGNRASILFDVMTHTVAQDSGVGDHGLTGITAVLAGHICDTMCEGLEMGEENLILATDGKKKKAGEKCKGTKGKGTGKSRGKQQDRVESSDEGETSE